jgi:hypoxanthine phosphoribosyltransferase
LELIEVSWDEYDRLIEDLALLVGQSGFRFEMLLCLARGGLRVGDVLSRVFHVPLSILAASSYREAAGTQRGELDIAKFITGTQGEPAGSVLLVDDLADSGATLAKVSRHLQERYPAVTEIRTAVLWTKAGSLFRPDYVIRPLAGNPWIVQPFEIYDAMDIQALARRRRQEKP